VPNSAKVGSSASAVWFVLAALATLGVIAAMNVVSYLPTHDGPQHVYQVHVENHFGDPGAPYSDFYAPAPGLAARGFSFVYGPLEAVLPWRPALRIALTAIVLLWCWGACAWASSLGSPRRVLGLVGFAAAFQWSLYMGFFSYVLSMGLGFFTLAIAFGAKHWSWRRRVAIGALLLMQSMSHVFATEVVGVCLLLLVACRAPARKWGREIGLLALMGAPSMLLALYAAGFIGGELSRELPVVHAAAVWWPLADRVSFLASTFVSGPWWRSWLPILLGAGGLVAGAHGVVRGRIGADDKALLIFGWVMLALALFAPLHTRTWEYVGPRFLPPAVLAGALLVPLERLHARAAWGVTGALTLLVGASLTWSGWYNVRLTRACADALSGLDAGVVGKGPRLPVILDSTCTNASAAMVHPVPLAQPLANVGALYAVEQGGVVPFTFVGLPQVHSFVTSKSWGTAMPPLPDKRGLLARLDHALAAGDSETRRAVVDEFAEAGAFFDDVILQGTAADRAQLEARGFRTEWTQGGTWIGRFVGCPLTLSLRTREAQTAPVLVEYGWRRQGRTYRTHLLPPKAVPPADVVSLDLATTPCGDFWVRVILDLDGSGGLSAPDRVCEGADAKGRLLVGPARPRRVDCRLSGTAAN